MDLSDRRWTPIEPLFETTRRADGRGRPWHDPRVAPDYRRLVIRWERHADNVLATLHPASALILLKPS